MANIQLSEHFTFGKLLRFVFPSVCMMVFTSIYGVVDGLFVSNFAGDTAFASINLIMPFLMILGGVGFLFGTGGSALVAKTLGEGDKENANRYFSMVLMLTAITGATLSVIGIVFLRPISYFLGASEEMISDCVIYGRWILGFNVAFMLQNVFQSFLVTAERPKLGLVFTVAAGVTNMVLDALFVAVFKWGVAGAAIATGLSQSVGGIIPLIFFMRSKTCAIKPVRTKIEASPMIRACINGSSELMSSISSSVVGALYNFQLMRIAGKVGVAAYGVLMYVQFIFLAIFIGYSIGMSPIVSYHYGSGNKKELKNLLLKGLCFMAFSGTVMFALSRVLAAPLASIFVGYNEVAYEMTNHGFMIISFAFLPAGFNILSSAYFTALNNGGVSAAISFIRTLLFQTLSVIVLPILFDLEGVWWSIAAAEIFAFVVSAAFIIAKRKKYGYL